MKQFVQKINTSLNLWLSQNDFNCSVIFGDYFNYDYLNKVITYTFFDQSEDDKLFNEVCKSIYNGSSHYSTFILSFLHELGHYATEKNLIDSDFKIQAKYEALDNPTLNDTLEYFVSYPEWEATNWACNYIKQNKNAVLDLSTILDTAYTEFLKYTEEEKNESN